MVAAAGPADSTPRGAAIDILLNMIPATRIFLVTPTRGATVVNITTTSKQLGGKMEARVFLKKKFGSLRCQAPENHNTIIEVKSKSTNNGTTLSIIGITGRGKVAAGRKVYASSGSRSNRYAFA
jgi:hypothetical protein